MAKPTVGQSDGTWGTEMDAHLDVEHNADGTHTTGTIFPAWTAWTPQLYQNANIASTNTHSKYTTIGKTVIVTCNITATAAGTAANAILIKSLPVTMDGDPRVIGQGMVVDTGTASYPGAVTPPTTTSVQFTGYGQGSSIGVAPSFAIANGDIVSFTVTYEKA